MGDAWEHGFFYTIRCVLTKNSSCQKERFPELLRKKFYNKKHDFKLVFISKTFFPVHTGVLGHASYERELNSAQTDIVYTPVARKLVEI